MLKDRYLTDHIIEDLEDKMVFIGGPREKLLNLSGYFDHLNPLLIRIGPDPQKF